jgi:hypothetical protein
VPASFGTVNEADAVPMMVRRMREIGDNGPFGGCEPTRGLAAMHGCVPIGRLGCRKLLRVADGVSRSGGVSALKDARVDFWRDV